VIDGSGVVVYSDDTSAGVNMFADAANYAHHQALASQAARVRELEEALTHIVEYWNRSENDRAMSDALYHMIETAQAALTPKEAT
jgi:hypothetical protein